jgi:uncharacterized protein HemX
MEDWTMSGDLPVPAAAPRRGSMAGMVVILLVLIMVAAGALGWREVQRLRVDIAAVAKVQQRTQAQAKSLGSQIADVRTEIKLLHDAEAQLAPQLAALSDTVQRMEQDQGNVDFALAELEHLFNLAEQQLTLTRDVDAALAALLAAQRRLAGLDAPGLDALRGQLEVDLLQLQNYPRVDFGTWNAELTRVSRAAEQMPLRRATDRVPADANAEPSRWRGLWHAMWKELRALVVVKKASQPDAALPSQRQVLIQSLQLRIESMRLALLRRDAQVLQETARGGVDWLTRWFDGKDAQVRDATEIFSRLAKLDPAPEPPAITSSL